MKRILKSGLSMVLALTIVLGSAYVGLGEIDFAGFFAVKAEAASESDLTFTLNDNGKSYSVSACNESASGELVIPSTYNSLPVTSIGDSVFEGCTNLTSVTIGNSVTSIGDGAFYNTAYYNNESNWVDGVLYIGNHLIQAKNTMNGDYIIKDGTKTIADSAFYECTSLTSINIPDSVISIGDYAFAGCTSLESITIPNSVTSIGNYVFWDCTSLESITIPDSVISIGDGAFSNTAYYKNPSNWIDFVLYIGNHFIEAEETINGGYIIKYGTKTIADSAFSYCESLTSITIPNSVTSIGDYAFSCCESLTSVTIPDSVTSIGDDAFSSCTSLTSVTIPNSVTSIGDYAFAYCSSLTSVTIPDSVTSIGDGVFSRCKSLTSVTIPNSVTSIGDWAFYYCKSLTSVTIPNSVTSIGYEAFGNCTSLASVTIPNSVTSIGLGAFNGCNSLIAINVDANNKNYSSVNGVLFNKDKTVLIRYPIGKNNTEYTIPDSVTSIEVWAFCDCTSLTSITIPDSITSIGTSAFYNTAYYNNSSNWVNAVLYIGNHLIEAKETINGGYIIKYGTKTIAMAAFSRCSSLTSVTIPNSVKSIGTSAFNGCTNLTSITIPDSVTSIGASAFRGCSSLTSINVDANNKNYSSVNGVLFNKDKTVLIQYPMRKPDSEYTIPESVTSIGDGAFYYCKNLTSITIPDSVTSIVDCAFYNCGSLKYVFYTGSETGWANITIGTDNTQLTKLPIHYNATGHTSSDWIIDKNATCTEYGTMHKECTVCGEVLETEVIAKTGHTSSDWITDKNATCTEDGSKHKECTVCGEVLETVVIAKAGHKSSDWIVDKVATCTEDGSKHKECTVCGKGLETEAIAKMGHVSSDWIIESEPTCTNNGLRYKKCALCDVIIDIETIKANCHIGGDWITDKEPTCTEDGSKHKECTVCGEVLETEVIAKTGHVSSDWIVDKKATCTEDGSKHKECTVCGEVLETEVIAKTAHKSSDWITDKNATLDAAGAKHKECTVCKAVLEKATIPQLKCAAPKLTKVESTGSGVKVTWGKTAGADSYIVYRKTYSNGKWSGWSTIKTGATGTTYTDATAKSGVYYIYTVRGVNEAGKGSYNSTGLKIKSLATPKLSSVSNGSGKVTVKWGKVTGASSYTVYRKTYSNGKWSGWSKIGTTKNTYYNDAKVSSGKYYKYTVRATSGDYSSYYNTSGLQIKYLAGPKISSASSRRDGILINWNKITGASGYYVYRKTSSGDWKKIATVKGNTKIKYLDETPRKGVTYQYRVKAYSGNYTSTYANTYKITCKY